MSREALDAKKRVVQDYFVHHPDSREVVFTKNQKTVSAFFDYSYDIGTVVPGNGQQKKRVPRITCFSGDVEDVLRGDQVEIGDAAYSVVSVQDDRTEETFQCDIRLAKK